MPWPVQDASDGATQLGETTYNRHRHTTIVIAILIVIVIISDSYKALGLPGCKGTRPGVTEPCRGSPRNHRELLQSFLGSCTNTASFLQNQSNLNRRYLSAST